MRRWDKRWDKRWDTIRSSFSGTNTYMEMAGLFYAVSVRPQAKERTFEGFSKFSASIGQDIALNKGTTSTYSMFCCLSSAYETQCT